MSRRHSSLNKNGKSKRHSFEHIYAIKGDGVAVLKPGNLRKDEAFVRKIREMREYDIVEQPVTDKN